MIATAIFIEKEENYHHFLVEKHLIYSYTEKEKKINLFKSSISTLGMTVIKVLAKLQTVPNLICLIWVWHLDLIFFLSSTVQ